MKGKTVADSQRAVQATGRGTASCKGGIWVR